MVIAALLEENSPKWRPAPHVRKRAMPLAGEDPCGSIATGESVHRGPHVRSAPCVRLVSMASFYRLPVVSHGAEFLVQGLLMRRNILTYKAPPGNEGYDLICIHPEPRHKPGPGHLAQVRVQVKSRYSSNASRGFPVKEQSLDAFDFVVVAFLNIGAFSGGKDGASGARAPEFYTLPASFVRQHHDSSSTWQKVHLRGLEEALAQYRDDAGFEQIAELLGVERPRRPLREG